MIPGVDHEVGPAAVVVRARDPLRVLSSAVVGGGLGVARAIVNLHVVKNFHAQRWEEPVADYARRHAVPSPWIGLLTSAWTEEAQVALEAAHGITALAIVTVGLGNAVAAGLSARGAAVPSTINTIVVVDARPTAAAMVNTVITVTEVKTGALIAAGVRGADGLPATGTSTDAVVIAATERGEPCEFGGPISDLGSVVARATRRAMDAGIARWLDKHGSSGR